MMHNSCPSYKQVSSYNVSKYPIFHSITVYGAIRLYEYIVTYIWRHVYDVIIFFIWRYMPVKVVMEIL